MRFRPARLAPLCLLAGLSTPAPALDWPQWQGPDRTAVSRETGLLKEWPQGGPPLAWKVTGLGGGYGAPAVAAGRLYGMSNRGDDQVVWARAEPDGKELWAVTIAPAVNQGPKQGIQGPGCTPSVDGDRLYAIGHAGDVVCLSAADGKIVWRKSMVADFGGRPPTWRYNESPLIDGDKLICTPGGADAILVALDKATGKTIWKSQVPGMADANPGGGGGGGGGGRGRRGGGSGAAYASAIAIDFAGQRQYVQLTAKALIGVAAADGKLLWRYDRPANRNGISCSTPLYLDGCVFASSAYGAGGGLVKLSKAADGSVQAQEVYFTDKMQNHHGGMIVVGGALYAASGGNEGGGLACIDVKTGKVLWDQRDKGRAGVQKGSIALADGRLYYRTEQGAVLLIEPNAKEYTERGRLDQPDRTPQPAWTHPVIANGKLYVRDQDTLYCYDVKAK